MLATLAAAAAIELFVATGPTRWTQCPGVDCWQQPPLPAHFNMRTRSSEIGVRVNSFELRYADLGRIGAWGLMASDDDYHTGRYLFMDRMSTFSVKQHSTAVIATYAPRFGQAVWVQPSIGIALVHERLWSSFTPLCEGATNEQLQRNDGRLTPAIGLRVGGSVGQVRASVGADYLRNARYAESVGKGVTTYTARVGYAFN